MKNEHIISVPVPEEFRFMVNVSYLARSTNECLFEIKDDKVRKAISFGNEVFLIEVSENHDGSLLVRFIGARPTNESMLNEVIHYVQDWFDLDTDLKPFYAMAEKDLLLEQSVKAFYGLRILGIPDLFEALCWGILGQQINLTYAYTLKRRLVEAFGTSIEREGNRYWIFPPPEDIAKLTVEDLSVLKMTVKKCEYLIGVAQLMAEGSLSKELLRNSGDFKAAEKMLVKIRGIGPWTANYVLMRCLRFPNAFPIADVGLHNAIKQVLGTDRKPTIEEILELSAPWTDWEAYATFYLWRILY